MKNGEISFSIEEQKVLFSVLNSYLCLNTVDEARNIITQAHTQRLKTLRNLVLRIIDNPGLKELKEKLEDFEFVYMGIIGRVSEETLKRYSDSNDEYLAPIIDHFQKQKEKEA